jgi:hypothetical protein
MCILWRATFMRRFQDAGRATRKSRSAPLLRGHQAPSGATDSDVSMFYTAPMQKPINPSTRRSTLSVRIGSWFETQATGWGIVAAPLVVLLVVIALLARAVLG